MNLVFINELGPNFRGDNIYGEGIETVENKLYEKDIVLKWEKNLVSDETYE